MVVALRTGLVALASPVRMRLLRLARSGLCVGEMARRLDLAPATVSHHLSILQKAGLVTARRQGYFVHYRPHSDGIRRLAHSLFDLAGELESSADTGRSLGCPSPGDEASCRP